MENEKINYAVCRVESAHTLNELKMRSDHNERQEQAVRNKNHIDQSKSSDNIDFLNDNKSVLERFYEVTMEYRKQHNEKMKHTRKDRQKTFEEMLDSQKNVVANEILFSSSKEFMNNLTDEQLEKWAKANLEFINYMGIRKENVISAVIHKDEVGAYHMHCIFVPLKTQYDKRQKKEVITIAKNKFWSEKGDGSLIQTTYTKHMQKNGFSLVRGVVNSDRYHLSVEDYKKAKNEVNAKKELLENELKDVENMENHIKETKEKQKDKLNKLEQEEIQAIQKHSCKLSEIKQQETELMENHNTKMNELKHQEIQAKERYNRQMKRYEQIYNEMKEDKTFLQSLRDKLTEFMISFCFLKDRLKNNKKLERKDFRDLRVFQSDFRYYTSSPENLKEAIEESKLMETSYDFSIDDTMIDEEEFYEQEDTEDNNFFE